MTSSCRYITFFLFCFSTLLFLQPGAAVGDTEKRRVMLAYINESPEVSALRDGLSSNLDIDLTIRSNPDESFCTQNSTILAYGADTATKILEVCPNQKMAIISSHYMINIMSPILTKDSWGYYMDQPLEYQVKHADLNMPTIRTLGILYTSNDSEFDQIKKIEATPHRILIKAVKIEQGQVAAQIMRELYQSVDAVLITGNSEIWPLQDFKTFLVLGMRQNKIMIGGYNYLYTNRGSISAIHTDFHALGLQIAKDILEGKREGYSYFDKRLIVTNDLLSARYGIFIGDKATD